MGMIQHKTLAATLPDLIKKTAAHKLIWEAFPNNTHHFLTLYDYYKSVLNGGFVLMLRIMDRSVWVKAGEEVDKFRYELTLSHTNTNQIIGDLDSKDLDSHTKRNLKRLYSMVTKMYPSGYIDQAPLVKSFHRILRAL